ncbi:MAG: dihydroorotase [Dehalococcoidia bacterium]|nr:dihydroorotase [Dehalococcoidia bacterium]
MKDILIKNGRIINPATGTDEIGDLLLSNGRIKQLGQNISCQNNETIDATSLVVCPGFVDLHCHLRQPGFEAKETISSGSKAAAKGGFTTVCCMPNTNPPLDNLPLITYVNTIAEKEASIRILPIGCITRARKGDELADMAAMAQAGVVGFSDDGSYVKNPQIMRRAMEYSLPLGLPVIEHCEDTALAADGQMNEGIVATALGLCGIPAAAEDVAVARDIILAELTGARLHIAHVSTKGAVELIRQGKKRGVRLTAEVTPHHLALTEERVLGFNTQAKVAPPLRTQSDIDALIEGLIDGTIDAIATDHAPHTINDKLCEFGSAACGISGLETAFAVLMKLVHSGKLPLPMLIAKLTNEPASILRMRLGSLEVGAPADIAIFAPDIEWTVDTANFASKGHNTPFAGETLKGKVRTTIYSGQIVYQDNE